MKISLKYYMNNPLLSLKYKKIISDDFIQQNTTRTKIYLNQVGFDNDKPKLFTATNIPNGSMFRVRKANDKTTVYTGTINGQKGDFSDFINNYSEDTNFYITCEGVNSYNFKVANNLLNKISLPVALDFMEQSRQDTFSKANTTGYGWRDGHQFSFELSSLVQQYMANPSYYDNNIRDCYKANECEYTELQTQNEPNIIWLMKFAVTRYYKWATEESVELHAFIKGELAYFLYIYPYISNYISSDFYTTIRDFTISQWSITTCNKSWYDVIEDHNLFNTQSVIGTEKGSCPPGYAIVPNLMMYEICLRDGLTNAQDFLNSAYNNCQWVINEVDLHDKANTKGQRMSERITLNALSYFYKMFPDLSPSGLYNKINNIADVFIKRSDNLWDFRKMSTPEIDGEDIWCLKSMNECGNVTGFPSVAYSCAMCIDDAVKKKRLEEIAIAHFDNFFGRNPLDMHFCNKATTEFDGADKGWSQRMNGLGDLTWCIGSIDGSPKNNAYPYDPSASTGYSEGWVAFNTAWNSSLAYFNYYYTTLELLNNGDGTIQIKLKAPLNMSNSIDTGIVVVNGTNVVVTEENNTSDLFIGKYTIADNDTTITASYGIGIFKTEVKLKL